MMGFLAGLGKSGTLRISHDRWSGEVVFERGQAVAAKFGSERGQMDTQPLPIHAR